MTALFVALSILATTHLDEKKLTVNECFSEKVKIDTLPKDLIETYCLFCNDIYTNPKEVDFSKYSLFGTIVYTNKEDETLGYPLTDRIDIKFLREKKIQKVETCKKIWMAHIKFHGIACRYYMFKTRMASG